MTEEAIILVISCLGIAQALFLIIYLITLKKGSRQANVFLAFVLLGLTIRIGKSILNVYLDLEPWQRNLGIAGILLVGPFLWFYGEALFKRSKKFKLMHFLHLLPYVCFTVFCAFIPNDSRPISYIIYISVFMHLAIYIGLSTALFFQNKGRVQQVLLNWYRNLVIGVALIWAFYIGNVMGLIPLYIGGAIFFSFLIYTFSFLLLQRHDFSLEKYRGSTIDLAASKELMTEITKLFDTEALFLDPTVSLAKVAEKVASSPRDVSRAINENEGKNFSEFVNGYRIQKAKALLADTEYRNEKIATVAYDCGFGNVTSFNLAFKAATGFTPSQYRNRFKLA